MMLRGMLVKSILEEWSEMKVDMKFEGNEIVFQWDNQIKERAEMLGLTVGEYLKRLAMADIRSIDGLEVEEKYRVK